MTYLLLDQDGGMIDIIKFETEQDVQSYQANNPEVNLELTDDLDDLDYLDNEDNIDEW